MLLLAGLRSTPCSEEERARLGRRRGTPRSGVHLVDSSRIREWSGFSHISATSLRRSTFGFER